MWCIKPACGSLVWVLCVAAGVSAGTTGLVANPAPPLFPATRPVDAATLQPLPLLTFDVAGQSPRQLFAQFSERTGVTVYPSPSDLLEMRQVAPVEVSLREVGFWRAARDLSRLTGVGVQLWERDLVLMAGGNSLQGAFVSDRPGLYAILSRSTVSGTADLVNERMTRTLTLSLSMFLDPRLHVLYYGAPRLVQVTDELGHRWAPNVGATPGMVASSWQVSQSLSIPLTDGWGRRLNLEGYLPVVVGRQHQVLLFAGGPDAGPPRQEAGPWVVELAEFRATAPAGATASLQVVLTFTPRDGVLKPLPVALTQMVRMVDAGGASLQRQSTGMSSTDGVARFNATYLQQRFNGEAAAAPVRIRVEIPLETEVGALPFEFAGVPLP
jgi:hypothetical protein